VQDKAVQMVSGRVHSEPARVQAVRNPG
jgi:hypothetical protein